jgi:hypothetical protein
VKQQLMEALRALIEASAVLSTEKAGTAAVANRRHPR